MFAPAHAAAPPDFSDTLKTLFEDKSISLTQAKLITDGLVDPGMDREATEKHIKAMALEADILAGPRAAAAQKVLALKQLIYKPGPWNHQTPFGYDFDNPQGRLAEHKTLAHYIETKKGNCVSMPLLFLAVADEMGVTLNIATAPQHVFIQFEDPETGAVQHLETTSGADPQRLVWQRKVLPMTDRAVESGMYMKRLTRNEMIAVMAETLLQDLAARQEHEEALQVAAMMLEEFPQFDVALLHRQFAAEMLIRRDIVSKYPDPAAVPPGLMSQFEEWAQIADHARNTLFDLGWRPKDQIDNSKYSSP